MPCNMPAVICPKCRYLNPAEARSCNLCSETLSADARPAPGATGAGLRPGASASVSGGLRPAIPAPGSGTFPPARPSHPLVDDFKGNAQFIVCVPYPPLRLHASFQYTIGREKDNNICLPAKIVSRIHAVIQMKNGVWTIADQRSANGTFVNGQRIQAAFLRDKDKIRISTFSLVFRDIASASFHGALESREFETETLVIDEDLVRRIQEGKDS